MYGLGVSPLYEIECVSAGATDLINFKNPLSQARISKVSSRLFIHPTVSSRFLHCRSYRGSFEHELQTSKTQTATVNFCLMSQDSSVMNYESEVLPLLNIEQNV